MKPLIGLAISTVTKIIKQARKINPMITTHSFILRMGEVNPPTKLMTNAIKKSIKEIGVGIPDINVASLLAPISYTADSVANILFAATGNPGT